MKSSGHFKAAEARAYLCKRGLLHDKIVRYCYRPFDVRWIYWEPETALLDRKREDFFPQVFEGNLWIEARQKQVMESFDRGYVTRWLADNFGNGLSSFFPLQVRRADLQPVLFSDDREQLQLNLSADARKYISDVLGRQTVDDGGKAMSAGSALFMHTIAILHSPAYRALNAGALRQDWPRVPLPRSVDSLTASAALGQEVAGLLDVDTPVRGVTVGSPRDELRLIALIGRVDGHPLNTANLVVKAGWGHTGQDGATMPGKGKFFKRDYSEDERAAVAAGCAAFGLGADGAFASLGQSTLDAYLNDDVCWKNVPLSVWEYTVGGYQILKKWLSYREEAMLCRPLTVDEAREFMNIARRIAAILLLGPQIDANYQAVKEDI